MQKYCPVLEPQELAERAAAAERDRADPFNAANRATKADPFVMAGEGAGVGWGG